MSKVITPDLIENFDSDAWLKKREEEKVGWKWDDDERLNSVFCMMKMFKITDPSQLKIKHFSRAKVWGAYCTKEYDNKHSVMIAKVLQKFGYQINSSKFETHMTAKDLKEYFSKFNYVKYVETPEDLRNKNETIMLLSEIQLIGNDILNNPLGMGITFTEYEIDNGVGTVYISVIVKSLKIIYNGSTNEFQKRMWEHKFAISSETEAKKFHKYLNDNNLVYNKDVVMIPVLKTALGHETLAEAALFDFFQAAEKVNKNKVELLTKDRPLKKKYNINSLTNIYKYQDFEEVEEVEEVEDSKPLYVGSANDFSKRKKDHVFDCYKRKRDNKFYKYIRTIQEDSWPLNIKMVPVELCPIYLRFQREKFYIEKYDLIENGLNSVGTVRSKQERLEYNREYAKNNKERIKETNQKLYQQKKATRTEAGIKKQKEKRHAAYEKNKEKVSQQSREWYQANKERKLETGKKLKAAKKAAAKNNAEASSSTDPLN